MCRVGLLRRFFVFLRCCGAFWLRRAGWWLRCAGLGLRRVGFWLRGFSAAPGFFWGDLGISGLFSGVSRRGERPLLLRQSSPLGCFGFFGGRWRLRNSLEGPLSPPLFMQIVKRSALRSRLPLSAWASALGFCSRLWPPLSAFALGFGFRSRLSAFALGFGLRPRLSAFALSFRLRSRLSLSACAYRSIWTANSGLSGPWIPG